MPFIVATRRPGAEPIPREFWREVPCGHPQDPVAAYAPDGSASCHCGRLLFFQDALPERPPEAPGPIVPCEKCGCYVAVPESPTAVVSSRAVATLEEARRACLAIVRPYAKEAAGGAAGSPVGLICLALMREGWEGGTVGPLPDGTVIEVEPVAWTKLAEDDKRSAKWAERGLFGAQNRIIAAYNAKQETSCA